MTEADGLESIDPKGMMEFVRNRTSDRKWRLYLCGGCRHIAHLFFRPESLAAVEVAERFADGAASQEELNRAHWEAESPTFGYEFDKERFSYQSPFRREVVPRLVEMGTLPKSALSGGEWQVDETVRDRLIAAATLAEYSAARSPLASDESSWGRNCRTERIAQVDWPGRWLLDCV